MPRRFRQLLTRTAICLALGTITTIAVAWGYTYFVRLDPNARIEWRDISVTEFEEWWAIETQQRFGAFRLTADPISIARPSFSGGISEAWLFGRIRLPNEIGSFPTWTDINYETEDFPADASHYNWFIEDARGWPWLVMKSRNRITIDANALPRYFHFQNINGIALPYESWKMPAPGNTWQTTIEATPWYPRVLPLRPIWPNFAYCVVFYVAGAWVILFARRDVRRLIRRQHGRCADCNYDLHNINSPHCPECGAAIEPQQRTSAESPVERRDSPRVAVGCRLACRKNDFRDRCRFPLACENTRLYSLC